MKLPPTLSLLLLSLTSSVTGSFPGQADQVHSLPGLSLSLPYRHYSGYLSSTNATFLHYWFFESQNTSHAATDPLVLWLNGGPGCSSLLGALTELGPLQFNDNGNLTSNPFAWNLHSNLLFIESPGGVGFSFKADHTYSVNDSSVAVLNHGALRDFYRKFPHLAENDFYMTGESYAGIYLPTLAGEVLEHQFPKHFKGVAIGNGFLDVNLLGNSLYHYYFYHGLLGSVDYGNLLAKCCPDVAAHDLSHCDIERSTDSACHAAISHALTHSGTGLFNPYNIYQICPKNGGALSPSPQSPSPRNSVPYTTVGRRLIAESLNQTFPAEDGAQTSACSDGEALDRYLNSAQVKTALHIDPRALEWSSCRSGIGYKREFKTMTAQVKRIINSGRKVLIYNGDIDTVCNYLGDEWFTDSLGYRILTETRPWTTPDGQVAGFAKFYEKNLAFATVLGAGHMVPEDKPEAALKLLTAFLSPDNEFR